MSTIERPPNMKQYGRKRISFPSRANVAHFTDYNRKCPSFTSTTKRTDAQNGWL